MKNFIQPGGVIPVTAPANVTSGDGVLVGTLFGVACHTALIGAALEIATEGVFELGKVSAQAWTAGASIFWDATAKKATNDDDEGGNLMIGHAVGSASNPSPAGKVRLSV